MKSQFLFLALVMTSCNFSEDLTNTSAQPTAHFAWLTKNLFQPQCISCHSSTTKSGGVDLSSYDIMLSGKGKTGKLITAKDPNKSTVYLSIAEGSMPPSGTVDPATLKSLKCWIEKGADQNSPVSSCESSGQAETKLEPGQSSSPKTSNPPSLVVTSPVASPTYKNIAEQVLSKNCIAAGCHNGEQGEEEYDLRSFEKVMQYVKAGNANDSLLYSVATPKADGRPPRMPPKRSGMPYLNQVQMDMLKSWINEGAKR